jgi:hypothetical protein
MSINKLNRCVKMELSKKEKVYYILIIDKLFYFISETNKQTL